MCVVQGEGHSTVQNTDTLNVTQSDYVYTVVNIETAGEADERSVADDTAAAEVARVERQLSPGPGHG